MQNEVSSLSASLQLLGTTLDEYMALQKAWMHLEPIFKAQDIQRALPEESRLFSQVDATFRRVVKTVADRPNVMHAFNSSELLQTLQDSNGKMEQIQVRAQFWGS